MPTYETVRTQAVPPELALRVAAGKAVEVLAIARFSGELPVGGADALRRTAELLRPNAEPIQQGYSLSAADSPNQLELLVATSTMLRPSDLSSLLARLGRIVSQLEAVASGDKLDPPDYDLLSEELVGIRRAMAAVRSELPDISQVQMP